MDYTFNYPIQKNLPPEFLTQKDARRTFNRIGFGLVALTVLFNVLAVAAQFFVFYNFPEIYETNWFLSVASFVPLYFIAVPVFALIILKLPKLAPKRTRFSGNSFFRIFTVCYALSYGGALISGMITSFFRLISGREMIDPTENIAESPVWINLIFVVLLAPVLEELVFRKLLLNRLTFLGERDAVIISSLAFGLMHGNFQQVVYATLIGIVFGAVYIRTGKLKIVIAYHMIFNFLGSVVAPFFARKILLAETSTNVTEQLLGLAAYVYSLLIFALIITGIVFFFKTIKNFRFRRGSLTVENKYLTLISSPGIIFAFAAFAVQFVLQIIYS